MPVKRLVLFLALLLLVPAAATAQDADPFEAAKDAFRDGRYAEAERLLERAEAARPEDPEIPYLIARLYTETPLRDRRKADRALDRALALKPDDVQLLVAQLQHLRTDSWNFFSEKIKEARRAELARKILALDSLNAFAHEELGALYIHDFWRYRNALMLPTLQHRQLGAARSDYEDLNNLDPEFAMTSEDALGRNGPASINPDEVFIADRFNVDRLREQGVPVQDLSGRAQRAYDVAIEHLQSALRFDPRRRSVYDHLMQIYTLKGEYQDALDMLGQMYVFFPEDPALWTYLGLAHYRLGQVDAAAKSFETAQRYMDDASRSAYERLDELLSDRERDAYAKDPVSYAARFWTSKDPRYLTPYNERKLEHFVRLTHADLLYGVPELDLRGWDTQRGGILVRYGVPELDVTIVPNTAGLSARRTLVSSLRSPYLRQTPGGNGGGDDEGNSDTDPDALNASMQTNPEAARELMQASEVMFDQMNTFNIWDYGAFRFVFEDPFRNGEYRLYSPPADEIDVTRGGVNPWQNDYALIAKETFRRVPERYEYEAPGRRIEMPYLVNAFKSADGGTDLFVHYGIPITSYDPAKPMIELTATSGTFLVSEGRDVLVERRRTIYGLRTDQIVPFDETNLWVDTQLLNAPAGTHELSVEFETGSGSTVAVQRRAVDVPDFSGDSLALSDVLLAYSVLEADAGVASGVQGAAVVRDGLAITPAPWSVFGTDKPPYLYFEVYNLARGEDGRTSYDVEVTLAPRDDAKGVRRVLKNLFGGDEGVSLSFSDEGTRADVGQYQVFDPMPAGLYTLTLRVRDNIAGRTVEREKDLFVE